MIKTCIGCGVLFKTYRSIRTYCSKKCYGKYGDFSKVIQNLGDYAIKGQSNAHFETKISEEHRLKIIERANKPEYIAISIKNLEGINSKKGSEHPLFGRTFPKITRQRMSEAAQKRWLNDKYRENFSNKLKEKWKDKDWRDNQVLKRKELWKNPEYRDRILKARFNQSLVSPNKLETSFMHLLNRCFPNYWRFVGNKYTFIAGKVPDFINFKNKQIIELFGDYWHSPNEEVPRIAHFQQYGYDCLVIWEHELSNEDNVIIKVKEFMRNGA